MQTNNSERKEGGKATLPRRTSYEAACLFADISGFTAASEALTNKYGEQLGAECLAKYINEYYFRLVEIFTAQEGDVFKVNMLM